MPEDTALTIVHRLTKPDMTIDAFVSLVKSQREPEVNRQIGMVADAIRDAIQPYREEIQALRATLEDQAIECGERYDMFEMDVLPI